MRSYLKIFAVVLTLCFSSVVYADLAIIVNHNYADTQLDIHNVKKIFLGERTSFPDGLNAVPFNHNAGSPDRKLFFSAVLSMDESSHQRHWRQKTKTNSGYTPVELNSHKAVLKEVAQTNGGISYIDNRIVDDSVKVLLVIDARGQVVN